MADDIKNPPTLEQALQQAADRKRELDIKEREVAAKEREVLAKEEELKRSRWLNPTVIGLFAAGLGLIGSVVVARVNNSNTQEVQRLQSEANITLEAIKTGTGNTDAACKNLIFFVGLGLVRDPEGKIGSQCKGTPAGPPSLPVDKSGTQNQAGNQLAGVVSDETHKAVEGASVEILDTSLKTITDKYGLFRFNIPDELAPRQVRVLVRKDGYKVAAIVAYPNTSPIITLRREPTRTTK